MIGKLIYLTVTRRKIFFIVGLLNQFMYKSKDIHRKAALRVLSYIKSSPRKGLYYKKHEHIHIFTFSDVGNPKDKDDRKSNTLYLLEPEGNLVSLSKKQDVS